jgi:hypothetical protein
MAVLNNKFLDFTNANNNLIGNSTTGASLTSGAYNNFFGRCAGNLTSTGDYNNFIGDRSGQNNTSGRGNNFLGAYAGQNNTSGRYNNFFGVKTGWCNQTGCDNIFFGRYAGCANVSGHNNIYMNSWSGRNATGCGNIFIGHFAGCTQTSGNNNVVIGSTNAVDTLQISGVQLPITTGSNQLVIGAGNTSWINGNNLYNIGIGTTASTQNYSTTVTGVNLTINGGIRVSSNYANRRNNISYTPSTAGATVTVEQYSKIITENTYLIDMYVSWTNTLTATVDIRFEDNIIPTIFEGIFITAKYIAINYLNTSTARMIGETTQAFYWNGTAYVAGTVPTIDQYYFDGTSDVITPTPVVKNYVTNGAWTSPSLALRTINGLSQPAIRLTRFNNTANHFTEYHISFNIMCI